MIENENISTVNTGCIPKVALIPVKTEISTPNSFLYEAIRPRPHELRVSADLSKISMDVNNSGDLHPEPAGESVKAPATQHRSKHVRSFSDCTGLSSASYDQRQIPPFTQVRNIGEKPRGNHQESILSDYIVV